MLRTFGYNKTIGEGLTTNSWQRLPLLLFFLPEAKVDGRRGKETSTVCGCL